MDSRASVARPPRVLVVDDFRDVVTMFTYALQQHGMEVISAPDGRAALAKVKEAAPNVIVSDVMMPEMDGLELCRQLRSDPHTKHIPIVMVTAGGPDHTQAALAAGCDRVLSKPCSPKVLVATIQSLITPELATPDQA
jgi:two-component system alkaline phosphatase synthesis response regulator PhoP